MSESQPDHTPELDPQDTAAPEDGAPADSSPLAALMRERDALQDRLLRAAAEFDNYRKRIERERRDLADYVAGEVLLEFLPVVDNLERAMRVPAADLDTYRTGVELIHKQLVDTLRKRQVTPIDAVGKDFDPNVHQAVTREVVSDRRDGEVMEELQRGYKLGDRLLRPAMVKVAARS